MPKKKACSKLTVGKGNAAHHQKAATTSGWGLALSNNAQGQCTAWDRVTWTQCPLVWGGLRRSNVITQLECGRERVINFPTPSQKPVGILMTPAVRSSVLCIIQKNGAPPAQPCCNAGCSRTGDRFGSEEGRGGAARARVPSAELPSVSYSTDGFLKGNQAGMTALTLLTLWVSKRLQQLYLLLGVVASPSFGCSYLIAQKHEFSLRKTGAKSFSKANLVQ